MVQLKDLCRNGLEAKSKLYLFKKMQTATQNLVGFFMEIQHSQSEVKELQEYLEALLEGETLAEGCEWEKKYGMFTLKDFQESFNWDQSVNVIVTEQICYSNMVRTVKCDSLESAKAMVNSKHYRDIPEATDKDWYEYEQDRDMDHFLDHATICFKVNNLHLKSGKA